MFKIGICDDDITLCNEIERYLERYAQAEDVEIDTEVFLNGEDLCRYLENQENLFHLIFLDIELGSLDGIAVGKILREQMKNEITQIVFVSYRQDYALRLFKVRPLDFLIKPLDYEKVRLTMELYRRLYPGKRLFFEYIRNRRVHQISQEEIICLKCEGKKIRLVAVKEEAEYYGKMADTLKQLNPRKFWVIHKSYIINVDYVAVFGTDEIKMTNGDLLPVSKSYKKEIRDKILDRKKRERLWE